jgi:hypothetical protein
MIPARSGSGMGLGLADLYGLPPEYYNNQKAIQNFIKKNKKEFRC